MLKKFLFLSLFGSALLSAQTTTSPAATSSTSNINALMDQALQRAEVDAQQKFNNATRRDVVPSWASKLELENSATTLDTKRQLVNALRGTQSLQNPAVQTTLLQILNKDIITEADLAALQNVINQAKMNAARPAQSAPITPTLPAPTPAPVTPAAPTQ